MTIVMTIAECVYVFVTVSANTILVMSVSITADPTTTSLLLIMLENDAATLNRVAIKVRNMMLVIVSVKSLNNDSLYPLSDDRANPLCDDS